MNIVIGSGKNRQTFEVASGRAMRQMAKENPIEHTKIIGNLKALVRRQPKISMTLEAFRKLQERNKDHGQV